MATLEKLIDIQKQYFSILENNSVIKECKIYDNKHFTLPSNMLDEASLINVTTSKGWAPSTLSKIERLFEDIITFWEKTANVQSKLLKELEGQYIHVQQRLARNTIKKYCIFFNGILVSDQVLLSADEYFGKSSLSNWKALVFSILRRAFIFILDKNSIYLPEKGKPLALIVPPQMYFDENVKKRIKTANIEILKIFLSNLLNIKFKDIKEYFDFCSRKTIHEKDLNPQMLSILITRYRAKNVREYINNLRSIIIEEQGDDLIKNDTIYQIISVDILARFREFERMALDAYLWEQEAEIPEDDILLYEWWFQESAKYVGGILGSSYSEDFLCKLAPHAPELAFLDTLTIEEIKEFCKLENVEELRYDLSLARAKIRKEKKLSLSKSISDVGKYIQEKLDKFDVRLNELKNESKKIDKKEATKLGTSCALTIAGIAFPPISALTLIYGGSLLDFLNANKEKRNQLEIILKRPITSLVQWREQQRITNNK